MHSKLKRRFDILVADRMRIVNDVVLLSDQAYNHHPYSGKWSVAQILTHIFTTEQMSLRYMEKKSLAVDQLADSGWLESVKLMILKISQRIPIKYKAPKVVAANTPESFPREKMRQQWQTHFVELETFLNTISEANLRKKIYKHPIAGRLDVVQALDFMQEHFHHHLPQLKRLLL